MQPCSGTVTLAAGAVVPGWRMGAVDFVSPAAGVGVTSPYVWCAIQPGHGNAEPVERPQTVMEAVTRDGGRDWTTVGAPAPHAKPPRGQGPAPEQVVTVAPARAYLLSADRQVLTTTTGGASWRVVRVPEPAVGLVRTRRRLWILSCPRAGAPPYRCRPALSRLDLRSGRLTRLRVPRVLSMPDPQLVAAGDHGVLVSTGLDGIVSTADGGSTWTVVPYPRRHGRSCPSPAQVAAADARTWWFLCVENGAAGSGTKVLLRTHDTGRHWTIASAVDSLTARPRPGAIPLAEPDALVAVSRTRLWLALFNGLAVSDDAGARWRTAPPRAVSQQGNASAFDVLSPRRGWLLAPGIGLWATADGEHWHAVGRMHTL